MEKFSILKYEEIETKKVSDNETSFIIKPLERGFANTLGNTIRRVLLSSITGVAPFAIVVDGASHEFQTLSNVTEDMVALILNLKTLRFVYNKEIFADDEIIKVTLKSNSGKVTSSNILLPPGVEVVDPNHHIAETSIDGALHVEMFLRAGRGFVPFDKNKKYIKEVETQLDVKIKGGTIIAIDSNFTPVDNVEYTSTELNSASAIIQEQLTLNVKTDGTVEAKDAVAQAANILIAHLSVIADTENLEKEEVFKDKENIDEKNAIKPISIASLELSVRSYNCLKRNGYNAVHDLSELTRHDLDGIKNLGRKSVEEIIEKLAEHGIEIKEGYNG